MVTDSVLLIGGNMPCSVTHHFEHCAGTLVLVNTTRPKTMECMDVQAVEQLFISRPQSLTRAVDGPHSLRGSLVPSMRLYVHMRILVT